METNGNATKRAFRAGCYDLRLDTTFAGGVMERRFLGSLADGMLRLVPTDDAEWKAIGAKIEQPLKELAERSRRDRNPEHWDGAKTRVPNGVRALLTGVSGTGKTMAAAVLAREVGLPLYRVDLSRVVSQTSGETEKNIDRVFEAASGAGAMLLFDEADALFGQRTGVKDAHDRYANLEAAYLLQRIESFPGIAILASNRKHPIDPAWLRRFEAVVQF